MMLPVKVQCKEAEKSCYFKFSVFCFHLTQVKRVMLDPLTVPSKLKPGILKECYYQKLSCTTICFYTSVWKILS